MKCLITGGAGFIGSHLAQRLVFMGDDVFILDNLTTGKKENIPPKANFFKMDIGDTRLLRVFEEVSPEIVFHLAAQINVRKSVEDPLDDCRVNILGTVHVIECARKAGCRKIIFASSGGAIYGDTDDIPTKEEHTPTPLSPYGIGKLTAEYYLQYFYSVFGLQYIALRFSNVYGPRQNSLGEAGVAAIFCDKILSGKTPRIYGDGKQTRDYVFVDDVVQALLVSMNSDFVGALNVGTGRETSVLELSKFFQKAMNYQGVFEHGPAKPGEQKRSCLDYSKIHNTLGWEPHVPLENGIERTAEWFKKKYLPPHQNATGVSP